MMSDACPERRGFERLPVDLEVEIRDLDDPDRRLIEVAEIENVSGGGIAVLSSSPDTYRTHQRVHLRIRLPAAERLAATLEGEWEVMWIGSRDGSRGEVGGRTPIGLSLCRPLVFDCVGTGSGSVSPAESAGRDP